MWDIVFQGDKVFLKFSLLNSSGINTTQRFEIGADLHDDPESQTFIANMLRNAMRSVTKKDTEAYPIE